MRIFITMMVAIICFGCKSLEQRCVEQFPPRATFRHDSTVYVERVDTFWRLIPSDTIRVTTAAPCDDFTSEVSTKKEKVIIRVKNRIIYVDRIKSADSVSFGVKCSKSELKSQVINRVTLTQRKESWLTYILGLTTLILLVYAIYIKIMKRFKDRWY